MVHAGFSDYSGKTEKRGIPLKVFLFSRKFSVEKSVPFFIFQWKSQFHLIHHRINPIFRTKGKRPWCFVEYAKKCVPHVQHDCFPFLTNNILALLLCGVVVAVAVVVNDNGNGNGDVTNLYI